MTSKLARKDIEQALAKKRIAIMQRPQPVVAVDVDHMSEVEFRRYVVDQFNNIAASQQRILHELLRNTNPMLLVKPETRQIMLDAITAKPKNTSQKVYANTAAAIEKFGPYVAATFIEFAEANANLSVKTLASYKSAWAWKCRSVGFALSDAEGAMLDDYVVAQHGIRAHTNKIRAALTREQLKEVMAAAKTSATNAVQRRWSTAWFIQYVGTLRPHDVAGLTPEHFLMESNVLYIAALRKADRAKVATLGTYEWHIIEEESAWPVILRLLQTTKPTAPLFPGYNSSTAGGFIKDYATRRGWNQAGGAVIDGTHCIRHTRATDVMKSCIGAVQATGAWSSASGARNYMHIGAYHSLIRKDALKRAGTMNRFSAGDSVQQVNDTIRQLQQLVESRGLQSSPMK